ncbi:cyclin-dependent kinases regulatory subunit 2 isoform X2 [Onychostruthus taczanowskii]|uniref:cyclin-dependent kinases regulatory subunit 2 isoform X2 n=1 Tax=Onychostruthus taczanowskii TaxID=356909 RepID=UPI001B8051CB|nr:cyclin-dependent kinases regulatory subunit 2 isoform X2 [Onychostruthus taczanowskii]
MPHPGACSRPGEMELSSLTWKKVSLSAVGGWNCEIFQAPSNHSLVPRFYESNREIALPGHVPTVLIPNQRAETARLSGELQHLSANPGSRLCTYSQGSIPRHVMLPRELSKQVPKSHLMSEEEWRRLGVQQSLGWVHYMIHEPEPHILLFRRPLPKDEQK